MTHSSRAQNGPPRPSNQRLFMLSLAIALCIAACVLIVLIPTTSITVDSVYQGF